MRTVIGSPRLARWIYWTKLRPRRRCLPSLPAQNAFSPAAKSGSWSHAVWPKGRPGRGPIATRGAEGVAENHPGPAAPDCRVGEPRSFFTIFRPGSSDKAQKFSAAKPLSRYGVFHKGRAEMSRRGHELINPVEALFAVAVIAVIVWAIAGWH